MRWSGFDGYVKTMEGTSVRTKGGAALTLLSIVFATALFFTELNQYLTVHLSETVVVDATRGVEDIKLHLKLEFPALPCADLTFWNEDHKGGGSKDVTSRLVLAPTSPGSPVGCTIRGELPVRKVAGKLRVSLGNAERAQREGKLLELLNVNGSHTVHDFGFGSVAPPRRYIAAEAAEWGNARAATNNPLDGQTRTVEQGAAQWQYYIKIVPTVFLPIRGGNSTSHQYSVTEYKRRIEDPFAMFGFLGLTQGQLPSVTFLYEFSPIVVTLKETQRSFLQFVTSVCAIIGGMFTLTGLLDRVLFKFSNAKAD